MQLANVFPPNVLSQKVLVTQWGMVGGECIECVCACVHVCGGPSAKHGLSLNTNASFDLPRLLGDLNNKICLSKFLNRLSLLCPNKKNPRSMFTRHPY